MSDTNDLLKELIASVATMEEKISTSLKELDLHGRKFEEDE
jgi:hypothetical protein